MKLKQPHTTASLDVLNSNAKLLMRVTHDGRFEWGEGATPDEAGEVFARYVDDWFLGLSHKLAACEARLDGYKAVAEAAERAVITESLPYATDGQNREVWRRAIDLREALAALDENHGEERE